MVSSVTVNVSLPPNSRARCSVSFAVFEPMVKVYPAVIRGMLVSMSVKSILLSSICRSLSENGGAVRYGREVSFLS